MISTISLKFPLFFQLDAVEPLKTLGGNPRAKLGKKGKKKAVSFPNHSNLKIEKRTIYQ